ncbi:MAG: NAD(P)/FAD-dependent oxidoreductase [Planctomycetota bacterium]|nr:NAD(P)/FAD-dependent oxidoreductase [Planctomycetota bacterium]
MDDPYDVVVIGAGPAGSTAGALLAEHGRRVLILEKEKFPRYKVGESLIPYCFPTIKRLGLVKKMVASDFVKKYSVQFISPSGKTSQPFYFHKHIKNQLARTWQVTRSKFDQLLLDNAREKGAEVLEETRVRELIWDGDRVVGLSAQGLDGSQFEVRAKLVIDASGRDAFSMRKNDWRQSDPMLNKVAVWSYFKGAKRDAGLDEGATTVAYIREKGWFWYLPLQDDLVSVGVVAEKDYLYREGKDPEHIFNREIKENKWIEEHVATGTQQGKYFVTGDYSYNSKYGSVDGLVLVGDALAFLDPVFSSGVFLALKGGQLVADAAHEALKTGEVCAENFEAYGKELGRGVEAMRRLVYSFYDRDFNFGKLLKKYPHLRADVTDCLIGHVDRDFSELWAAVSEFAELPPPANYGAVRAKAEK